MASLEATNVGCVIQKHLLHELLRFLHSLALMANELMFQETERRGSVAISLCPNH